MLVVFFTRSLDEAFFYPIQNSFYLTLTLKLRLTDCLLLKCSCLEFDPSVSHLLQRWCGNFRVWGSLQDLYELEVGWYVLSWGLRVWSQSFFVCVWCLKLCFWILYCLYIFFVFVSFFVSGNSFHGSYWKMSWSEEAIWKWGTIRWILSYTEQLYVRGIFKSATMQFTQTQLNVFCSLQTKCYFCGVQTQPSICVV